MVNARERPYAVRIVNTGHGSREVMALLPQVEEAPEAAIAHGTLSRAVATRAFRRRLIVAGTRGLIGTKRS